MKLFIDTNILLDLILGRNLEDSNIIEIIENFEDVEFYISALSIHIIFYILKVKYGTVLYKKITNALEVINIIDITDKIIRKSYKFKYLDFEDTIQYFSAIKYCDVLLTRNIKDFRKIQELNKDKKIKICSFVKEK